MSFQGSLKVERGGRGRVSEGDVTMKGWLVKAMQVCCI